MKPQLGLSLVILAVLSVPPAWSQTGSDQSQSGSDRPFYGPVAERFYGPVAKRVYEPVAKRVYGPVAIVIPWPPGGLHSSRTATSVDVA